MRPYLIRPPKVYRWLYSEAIFRGSLDHKQVYLTFDDGPNAEATPYVLDVLKEHNVKATFFVLGKNGRTHPELLKRIRKEGHAIGNHGMNHLSGWNSSLDNYLADANDGKKICGSNLFRPAYGKMTFKQYSQLKKTEQIVLWDVIAGDFDTSIDGERVTANVMDNVRNGSIVVLHDSEKALHNLRGSLTKIIAQLIEKGYTFGVLHPV